MRKIIATLAAAAALGGAAAPAQAGIGHCWMYSGHSSGYTILAPPIHLCKATLPLTLTSDRGGDLLTPAGRSTLFFLRLRAGQRIHIAMQQLGPAAQTVGVESYLSLERVIFDPWLRVGTVHGVVTVHAIGYFSTPSGMDRIKMIRPSRRANYDLCVDGTDPFSSPRIYPWPTGPECALTQNTGYGYALRTGYYLLAGTDGGTYGGHGGPPPTNRNRTVRLTLR